MRFRRFRGGRISARRNLHPSQNSPAGINQSESGLVLTRDVHPSVWSRSRAPLIRFPFFLIKQLRLSRLKFVKIRRGQKYAGDSERRKKNMSSHPRTLVCINWKNYRCASSQNDPPASKRSWCRVNFNNGIQQSRPESVGLN